MSLRSQLQTCQSRLHEIRDEIEAIGQAAEDDNRDISEDEGKIIDDLRAEFESQERKEKTLKGAVESFERTQRERLPAPSNVAEMPAAAGGVAKLPAVARGQRSKVFKETRDAYAMGRWLYGMCGDQKSREWAISQGYDYRNAQEVGTDTAGGFSVPTPLAAEIIRLIEEYGVFRQFSRNMPMSAMTLDVPKRTTGLTIYYPGEGNAIDLIGDR